MLTSDSTERFVQHLVEDLQGHPVNHNRFFAAFLSHPLSQDQLRRFMLQYHYFCRHFVKLLEGLLFHTPLDQFEMRVELSKTLYSELGSGHIDAAHITLLRRFLLEIGLDDDALAAGRPIDAVSNYMAILRRLFMDSGHLSALGAETAVEVTAVSEFRYLYPGLLKYQCFSDDALVFFKLHLTEEEHHADWLLRAVRKTALTPGDQEIVFAAARETADGWHAFWLGIYDDVLQRSPVCS